MFFLFSRSNKKLQFCSKCRTRAFKIALSVSCVIYFILLVFDENFDHRKFFVTKKNDYLILKNRQEIYKFVINRTNIEEKNLLKLLYFTLESYRPYKTPFKLQKIIEARAIPRELQIKYKKTITINQENFSLPLLIMLPRGRLGNLMGEYASLFSLGKLYNASVLLDQKLKEDLEGIFPKISLKALPSGFDRKKCLNISYDHKGKEICNYSPIQLAAAGLLGPKCFVINDYPFEMKLFHSIRKDIMKEFKFSDQILNKVQDYFAFIKETKGLKSDYEDYTFVGIHIRMTDYKRHMQKVFGADLPSDNYVFNAINYIKAKYNNPIFIAASDNVPNLKRILINEANVFYPDNTPEMDMAILSFCNHSIFTLGSFGFWTSYLAGGEVLYADVKTTLPYKHSTSFYIDANLTNFVHIEDIP